MQTLLMSLGISSSSNSVSGYQSPSSVESFESMLVVIESSNDLSLLSTSAIINEATNTEVATEGISEVVEKAWVYIVNIIKVLKNKLMSILGSRKKTAEEEVSDVVDSIKSNIALISNKESKIPNTEVNDAEVVDVPNDVNSSTDIKTITDTLSKIVSTSFANYKGSSIYSICNDINSLCYDKWTSMDAISKALELTNKLQKVLDSEEFIREKKDVMTAATDRIEAVVELVESGAADKNALHESVNNKETMHSFSTVMQYTSINYSLLTLLESISDFERQMKDAVLTAEELKRVRELLYHAQLLISRSTEVPSIKRLFRKSIVKRQADAAVGKDNMLTNI